MKRDGRTRGPTVAKDSQTGKYSVREKGEVGRGQRGESGAEKRKGTKLAGGYSQYPIPINGILSLGRGYADGGGQGLLLLEVASW